MKSFLFLVIFISSLISASGEYYQHKIYLKFKSGSPELINWNKNARQGSIPSLVPLLGKNWSHPFVRQSLLDMARSKKTYNVLLSSRNMINPLSRIAIIEYEKDIDPLVLSRKLQSYPFVDYAEPIPMHKILEEPNDPKRNGQYYLEKINVFDAWDVIDTTKSVLVGIVDTGIDYNHEDLAGNMYVNLGEDGTDSTGKSRRDNGIDDDNNGYIDDWHGWDFVSSDSSGQDNDPYPGHRHGSHVGGTIGAVTNNHIGIASVGRFVKLLPVKVGEDNPFAVSVTNGFEGIFYAGLMGAAVINCSWGSTTRSEAEAELISQVAGNGSIIVCAAGNLGTHQPFYPASYSDAVSVAALNEADERAVFSCYDETVDVSAPGEDILATIPDNSYEMMSGTSMASPIVAGVAALSIIAHPEMTSDQIRELLRVTCDNIYGVNPEYIGLLGNGRVNAYKAVTTKNARSVRLISYNIIDENGDGVLDMGEHVKITTKFKNILSPVKNVYVKVKSKSSILLPLETDSLYLGNMNSGDTVESKEQEISFYIPDNIPFDVVFNLQLTTIDSIGELSHDMIRIFANPSFRNLDSNNITTTLNSRGNIGFNDYPFNIQGIGLRYKSSQNILFEGGLIVGSAYNHISNNVRSYNQSFQDRDFLSRNFLTLHHPGEKAALEATLQYSDGNDSSQAGVHIFQKAYQFSTKDARDIIFMNYDIVNQTFFVRDSVFAGLFFDWDLGPGGANNKISYDKDLNFGFVHNVKDSSLPWVGVEIISSDKVNFYAIDNGGNSKDTSINIYNGFTDKEKWLAISNGLKRPESSVADASMVISAGPVRMLPRDTTRITFAIFAGDNFEQLQQNAINARNVAHQYDLDDPYYPPIPPKSSIIKVYPNPAENSDVKLDIVLLRDTHVSLQMFDMKGKKVGEFLKNEYLYAGRFSMSVNPKNLSTGLYLILMQTDENVSTAMVYIKN